MGGRCRCRGLVLRFVTSTGRVGILCKAFAGREVALVRRRGDRLRSVPCDAEGRSEQRPSPRQEDARRIGAEAWETFRDCILSWGLAERPSHAWDAAPGVVPLKKRSTHAQGSVRGRDGSVDGCRLACRHPRSTRGGVRPARVPATQHRPWADLRLSDVSTSRGRAAGLSPTGDEPEHGAWPESADARGADAGRADDLPYTVWLASGAGVKPGARRPGPGRGPAESARLRS